MRTIEAIATVTEDGKLTVNVPPDIPAGEHRVVLVVDVSPLPEGYQPLRLHVWNLNAWPADFTFRREDLYGDDGR